MSLRHMRAVENTVSDLSIQDKIITPGLSNLKKSIKQREKDRKKREKHREQELLRELQRQSMFLCTIIYLYVL